MDAGLILFRKQLMSVQQDPAFPCPVPSWSESLKVNITFIRRSPNVVDVALKQRCVRTGKYPRIVVALELMLNLARTL